MSEASIPPKVAASIKRLQTARKAAPKHGTPKAILEAFVPLDTVSSGVMIPVPNMGKILILESIESPFITGSGSPQIYDIAAALFILSQPKNEEIRKIIAKGAFQNSVLEWSDNASAGMLKDAGLKVIEAIDKAFATAISYGKEGSSPLAEPPSPTTGSGGSSPSAIV